MIPLFLLHSKFSADHFSATGIIFWTPRSHGSLTLIAYNNWRKIQLQNWGIKLAKIGLDWVLTRTHGRYLMNVTDS